MNASFSLFDEPGTPEQLALPDAEITFLPRFYGEQSARKHMQALMNEVPWRQDAITVWGKQRLQPRLTAWYGDAGMAYRYSGLRLDPLPWSPLLAQIKHDVEHASGRRFNSVLLNLYRDERDSVGWHSDDEPELGYQPFIASLSLGQTRTFRLRHKERKELKPAALDLTSGSLLLMGGRTQQYWVHAVDKERTSCGPRINLTFRTIIATRPR